MVNLQLLRNNKKVEQVVYGREYTLRADITDHDGKCRTSFIKLNVFKIYVIQIMNLSKYWIISETFNRIMFLKVFIVLYLVSIESWEGYCGLCRKS